MSRQLRGVALEIAETLVLTLIVFLVFQTFVAQTNQVKQVSMEDTLLPGQYIVVDKLTPHFEPYQRGDIVVFTPPGQPASATPYIKRIIGMPGDTLDLRDGHVFINGNELSEPYVYPGSVTLPLTGQSHWVLGPDQYFMLGDHREDSTDSRVFGPVSAASIIGRAWLRYWPIAALEVIQTPVYPNLSPAAAAPRASPDAWRLPRARPA